MLIIDPHTGAERCSIDDTPYQAVCKTLMGRGISIVNDHTVRCATATIKFGNAQIIIANGTIRFWHGPHFVKSLDMPGICDDYQTQVDTIVGVGLEAVAAYAAADLKEQQLRLLVLLDAIGRERAIELGYIDGL